MSGSNNKMVYQSPPEIIITDADGNHHNYQNSMNPIQQPSYPTAPPGYPPMQPSSVGYNTGYQAGLHNYQPQNHYQQGHNYGQTAACAPYMTPSQPMGHPEHPPSGIAASLVRASMAAGIPGGLPAVTALQYDFAPHYSNDPQHNGGSQHGGAPQYNAASQYNPPPQHYPSDQQNSASQYASDTYQQPSAQQPQHHESRYDDDQSEGLAFITDEAGRVRIREA